MKNPLPLVKLPPSAAVYRFGTPHAAPTSTALLRFPSSGWTVDSPESSCKQGWAIVGDVEGRRLAVEASVPPGKGQLRAVMALTARPFSEGIAYNPCPRLPVPFRTSLPSHLQAVPAC